MVQSYEVNGPYFVLAPAVAMPRARPEDGVHLTAAGVFGNVTGGVLGALIGGFMTSTIVAWGQFFMVRMLLSDTIPNTAMWAADSDMFLLGPTISLLAELFF